MKKLIIFDLNGVLIDREFNRVYNPECSFRVKNNNVWVRPGADDFFEYIFKKFHVGVLSCCTKKNADILVKKVFKEFERKLIFSFNGSNCRGLTGKEKRLSFTF